MLGWAITFLLVALVAAVLGFGGIASFAVDLAKQVVERLLVGEVDPRGRLVEEQKLGLRLEGEAEKNALHLPAR